MIDCEKVIADLRKYINYPEPLSVIVKKALELLKEQELTVKFSKNYMNYVCSNCGVYINDEIDFMMDKPIQYCPSCGGKVKWDADK